MNMTEKQGETLQGFSLGEVACLGRQIDKVMSMTYCVKDLRPYRVVEVDVNGSGLITRLQLGLGAERLVLERALYAKYDEKMHSTKQYGWVLTCQETGVEEVKHVFVP